MALCTGGIIIDILNEWNAKGDEFKQVCDDWGFNYEEMTQNPTIEFVNKFVYDRTFANVGNEPRAEQIRRNVKIGIMA